MKKDLVKFESIIKEITEIKKETIYNYDYKYFKMESDTLVPDENLNETYGSSRKGYELWSGNENGLRVGYSGVTSAREIYMADSHEVVGFVFETKKPTRPYIYTSEKLYEEVYLEFKKILEVKDDVSLKFYLNEKAPLYDFNKREKTDAPKIIIFSGTGLDSPSDIRTFRDTNGLWNEHKIEEDILNFRKDV